jgi:hypothetical protein
VIKKYKELKTEPLVPLKPFSKKQELEMKLLASKARTQCLSLRQKGKGVRVAFKLVNEEELKVQNAKCIQQFDASKLEAEYDYDTDDNQAFKCKRIM